MKDTVTRIVWTSLQMLKSDVDATEEIYSDRIDQMLNTINNTAVDAK